MSKRTRRNHAPAFKAKVALKAVKGEKTLSVLAQQFDVHPNRIYPGGAWKAQLVDGAAEVFGSEAKAGPHFPTLGLRVADSCTASRTRSLSRRCTAAWCGRSGSRNCIAGLARVHTYPA